LVYYYSRWTRKIPITRHQLGPSFFGFKDVKIERVGDVDGRATASFNRSSYVLY